MTAGEFIKKRREELGLSQTYVAQECGVSRSAVCKWESGDIHNAKREKIQKLAAVLQLDPMDITRVEIGEQVEMLQKFSMNLTPLEQVVIRQFRMLTPEQQGVIKTLIETMTPMPEKGQAESPAKEA